MNAAVTIEHIGPDRASEMLAHMYQKQRNQRPGWVSRLAGEMKAHKFKLSCDAVVLVGDELMNGQHRLSAVVESKTTQPFLVLRTEDKKIYEIIDSGIKRTVADCIDGENKTLLSAIAMWVMKHDRGLLTCGGKGGQVQRHILRSQVINFINKNIDEFDATVKIVSPLYAKNKFLAPSIAGGVTYLANRHTKSDSGSRFIEQVYLGTANDVTRTVRDRLINNRLSKQKFSTSYQIGLLIKAFKYWDDGENPGVLKITDSEEFPSLNKE